jgi:hypothetical protein
MLFYTLVVRENDATSSKPPFIHIGRIMRLGIMRYEGSFKVCESGSGLLQGIPNFEFGERGVFFGHDYVGVGCVRLIWPARLKSKSHIQEDLDSCLPCAWRGEKCDFHSIFALVK